MYSKVIRSGKMVEIFHYQYPPKNLYGIRRKKQNTKGTRTIRRRRTNNIFNTRRNFIRLIWANTSTTNPPTFVTLTFAQVLSYETSSILFTKFLARLRRKHGKQFRCIAVPEYQKRGALHFHCLFYDLPIDLEKEAPHWETTADSRSMESVTRGTRYLQRLWLYGYVDCLATDGHHALALYFSKYMSKSMQDIRISGKKAYYTTRNCLRPMLAKGYIVDEYMDTLVDIHSPTLQEREYKTDFMGRCNYKLVEAPYE